MEPKQQLRVLTQIWRGKEGYVFLPYIDAAKARGPERKTSWREGRAFYWPTEKPAILEHLSAHRNDDLYFAPSVFEDKQRREELATPESRLWADLDEVNPDEIEEAFKPTIAWETSPGRYAAVWIVQGTKVGASWAGNENHRLTMYLGADPSGWDTTQLLRVPGSANNKKANLIRGKAPRGKLLWDTGDRFTWDEFDALPAIEGADQKDFDAALDAELIDGIDRHAVWGKVRLKVSSRVRDYVRMRDSQGMDRSEIAWQIERDLADAGLTLVEMVAIMQPTPWNKYEGRKDEIKRLVIECSKALAARKDPHEDDNALEAVEDIVKPELVPFWKDDAYLNAPEPEWLVPDVIPRGGCGFIAGIPKSMKSWLSLDLAISLTSEVPFLGYDVNEPSNVLYIQQEDPTSLVRDRHVIIARSKAPQHVPGDMQTPPNGMLYMIVQSGFSGADAGWQEWLDEVVGENNIDLIIMDTLSTVAGGIETDKANEIKAKMLDPVKSIARKHDCAALFVHHMTKAGGSTRAGQNMAGSGQIHAWADFGLYVKEKTDDNRITFDLETKYTATRTLTFKIDGLDNEPKEWLPEEVLLDQHAITTGSHVSGKGKEPKYVTERRERKAVGMERVREALLAGKVDIPTLATELNLSVSTVAKYMKEIREGE